MRLSKNTEYAMIGLKMLNTNTPIKLEYISTVSALPNSFLEQIFRKLRMAGIVSSVRGPGGGYVLAKSAHNVMLLDVLTAMKEKTLGTTALPGLVDVVSHYLETTSLGEL